MFTGTAAAGESAPPPPDGAAGELKAGFAGRDITPQIGMEQRGNYGKDFHRIFHNACKVRAAGFDDGRGRLAIVGVDTLGIRADTVVAARKAAEEKCGIEPRSVLIALSCSRTCHSCGARSTSATARLAASLALPVGMAVDLVPGMFSVKLVRNVGRAHDEAQGTGDAGGRGGARRQTGVRRGGGERASSLTFPGIAQSPTHSKSAITGRWSDPTSGPTHARRQRHPAPDSTWSIRTDVRGVKWVLPKPKPAAE